MKEIIAAPRIFVMGAGREGISCRSFAMRLAHLGKETHWIWDDTATGINKGDLFILSDGRADVGMFKYILGKVKDAEGRIVMVTGCPGGPSAKKYADIVVYIPSKVYGGENPDVVQTIQLMGALYEQHLYLFFDIVIMMLKDAMGLTPEDMEKKHRNVE